MKTKQLTLCALFLCLITVGAFIKIPMPFAPVTLQLPMVILCGMLLKSKSAAVCTFLYLFMGLMGLPVFTGGGGFSYVLQPTFGYIIGFIPCTVIVGKICKEKSGSFRRLFTGGVAGLITVYALGFIYYLLICRFYLKSEIDLSAVFMSLCVITLPKDVIMCIFAASLGKRLLPVIGKS